MANHANMVPSLLLLLIASAKGSDLSSLKSSGADLMLELVARFTPLSNEISTDTCRMHSRVYLEGVKNLQPWALKMLDAGSKLQSGILYGNIKNLGNYDECVTSRGPEEAGSSFTGQFCLANVQVSSEHSAQDKLINIATLGRRNKEVSTNRTVQTMIGIPSFTVVQWAVCVPSSCSPRDVKLTLDQALGWLAQHAGLRITTEVFPEACHVKSTTTIPWTHGDIAFVAMILLLVLLVTVSSIFDLLSSPLKSRGLYQTLLLSFSAPANWKRLFDMGPPSRGAVTSLEGIRTLTTFWVIGAHEVIFFVAGPMSNKYVLVEGLNSMVNMVLGNNTLTVDTFFLMSAFLKTYNNLRDMNLRRYSVILSVLRRYLRLTPVFATMMFFYATWFPRLGSGPSWSTFVEQHSAVCRPLSSWLANLLYLNNYGNSGDPCMMESWYLGVDMQMFVLSPLLIYPLWRWPRLGVSLLVGATLVSVIIPFSLTFLNSGPPTPIISARDDQIKDYLLEFYPATHNRMASYFVGIALGFLFHNLNTRKTRKMSKSLAGCGWTVSLACMFAVVFGPVRMFQLDYQYDRLEASIYAGFHRFAWGMAVGWLILACHYGRGGWVNKFLSARVYLPLSRLCYCMYLTHMAVLKVNAGRVRTAVYADELIFVRQYLGDVIIVIFVSVILHIMVEAPMCEISKIVFKRSEQATKTSTTVSNKESGEQGV